MPSKVVLVLPPGGSAKIPQIHVVFCVLYGFLDGDVLEQTVLCHKIQSVRELTTLPRQSILHIWPYCSYEVRRGRKWTDMSYSPVSKRYYAITSSIPFPYGLKMI